MKDDDLVRREDVELALLDKGQRSRRYKLGETWELNFTEIREALADVPSAQPDWKNCKDRYDDLCDYFDNNPETIKLILWDRKGFKAWLERMHRHVRECNKLAREVDRLTKELEQARGTNRPTGIWQITEAYPHNVYCSNCHVRFAQTHWAVWEDGSLPRNYCPNCGLPMKEV